MRVGVGYSDNPDTNMAGMQAAMGALKQAGNGEPCDLVLVFAAARHEAQMLRNAIEAVAGRCVPIIGGAAAGAISNDRFGYAGDQIILAAFWLEGATYDTIVETGLQESEEKTGIRLGRRLASLGVKADSSVLLFYDSIYSIQDKVRLLMATPLIYGIEKSLGFLPNLIGAGLVGDYTYSPTKQLTGDGIAQHSALAVSFSENIRIDSLIMHGCRPATGYYTVTKADQQTVLEINGQPALQFVDALLEHSISPDDYPFFLIFGVNRGDKWGPFEEESYSNRLCLAIDKERNGIVMFEPDMVEGTEFQIMFRSFNLDYIPPRIEQQFAGLAREGRRPVFALYINYAGRAAGYAGTDLEDAIVIQKAIAGRAPLMGIYSGVEIASVEGRPRGLDWTGVFCLFSVSQ